MKNKSFSELLLRHNQLAQAIIKMSHEIETLSKKVEFLMSHSHAHPNHQMLNPPAAPEGTDEKESE